MRAHLYPGRHGRVGEVGKRMDTRMKVILTSAGRNKRSILKLWASEPSLCYGNVAIRVCPVRRMVESREGELVGRFPRLISGVELELDL